MDDFFLQSLFVTVSKTYIKGNEDRYDRYQLFRFLRYHRIVTSKFSHLSKRKFVLQPVFVKFMLIFPGIMLILYLAMEQIQYK